ncbi:hypothetical protein EXIGLDRAFT_832105 [Exidia glandulosa HHB12029]|uniref:Uncharacterized protein n=1 Tax=Exidia glandulosa HHB12029 TaxID=1314781 RepID=A0A165LZA0_EXIGL|nr:hypothetical protein EXIGLDRAFT_832105 [Exidia glandulosa HHB12029]
MVDWHDPTVQMRTARVASFITNVAAGCYIWEFLLAFHFDWEHLTRRRPLRWSVIPYIGTRYTCLFAIVAVFRVSNVFHPEIGCTAWWKFIYISSYTAVALASLLLVIRVVAVSLHSRWVSVALGILWVGQVVALLYGAIKTKGVYMSDIFACNPIRSVEDRYNTFAPLALDIVCLALVTCFVWREQGAGTRGLLIQSGVIYFIIPVLVYLPLAILQALNLNDGMNLLLQVPALITLVTCATRLYREHMDLDRHTLDTLSPNTSTLLFHRPALSPRSTTDFPHQAWHAPRQPRFPIFPWRRHPEPERGIVVPPSFAGASVDYHERESVPTAVSPNSSRGKITMFKDSTDQLPEQEEDGESLRVTVT